MREMTFRNFSRCTFLGLASQGTVHLGEQSPTTALLLNLCFWAISQNGASVAPYFPVLLFNSPCMSANVWTWSTWLAAASQAASLLWEHQLILAPLPHSPLHLLVTPDKPGHGGPSFAADAAQGAHTLPAQTNSFSVVSWGHFSHFS